MTLQEEDSKPTSNGGANSEHGTASEKVAFLGPSVEVAPPPYPAGIQSKTHEPEQEPEDRFYVVYIVMLIHGIGTLMPWNMFITATGYFIGYKLAGEENEGYAQYFLSTIGFAAQIPSLLLNLVNVFAQSGGGGSLAKRITWSIIIVVICFIFTIVLAMLDSSSWTALFFWITMISVVIINSANGVYQNSIYGTAAFLPMKYTNAVVTGSNFSGLITAVLNLIAIAAAPNPRTAAIYYFLAAVVVLLLAFDAYFVLPLSKFYRFYRDRATKATENQQPDTGAEAKAQGFKGYWDSLPPYGQIFKKCYVQHLSVWFVFFVTLSCFPALQAGIVANSDSFLINEKYFTAVTCFLVFNSMALLGNIATELVKVPGPRWVWLPVLLRGFFIPFFMYCNFNPDKRALPVLITNDYVYVIAGIVFAFTSGYFSSLCMMYAPSCVEDAHKGIAGMLAAFFLILGIFTGVLFSFPIILFVNKVGPLNPDLVTNVTASINASEPLLLSTVPTF